MMLIFELEGLSDLERRRNEIYKLIVGLIFRVRGVAFLVKNISFAGGFATLEILPASCDNGLENFVDWPVIFDKRASYMAYERYKLPPWRVWWRQYVSHAPIGRTFHFAYAIEGKIIVSTAHHERFKV